ncbi:MAG: PIG-L family deacetylase [Bacteroidetes bacterium]|nr:PIG-L family deacetylase [Bacteroidota bacterium]
MTSLRSSLRLLALTMLCASLHQGMLSAPRSRTLIPDTGATAVRMRAMELTSGLRVLAVSLRPGDEDLATLAYLRLGAAAQVTSVYVTNGESGEHDAAGALPRELAAERRNATATTLARMEADTRFLNLADPGSVADSAGVRAAWPADSLERKLRELFGFLKPHVILLFRDWDGGSASPLWKGLSSTLRDAVSKNNIRKSALSGVVQRDREHWTISRLWVDEGKGQGVAVLNTGVAQALGRTFEDVARELATEYSWQAVQRNARDRNVRYSAVISPGRRAAKRLDEGVEYQIPRDLKNLHAVIRSYGKDVLARRSSRAELLGRTLRVVDSVDAAIGSTMDRSGLRMKQLIDWKGMLENLRNALLGVTVEFTLSENVLAPRQLTHVRIQSVTGIREDGSTDVYFPAAERGWILNEGIRSTLPLEVPGEYRIISPEHLTYDLPQVEYSLDQPVAVRPVMLFLLHRGKSREENFTYRISLPIRYAPRFATEILTPIVRCSPGEFLVTRMTNNSRDGLRDTVAVNDSIVRAAGRLVRLNGKGLSQTDTLHLIWRDSIPEGVSMVPVTLGGIEVGRFAARRFDAAIDTSLAVGLLTALKNSPTAVALRRLGLPHVHELHSVAEARTSLAALAVLIIDRRYTTLSPRSDLLRALTVDLTQRGGHVIILAQDAQSWNASPLWETLRLQRDPTLAAQVPAFVDTTHRLLRVPNRLDASVFQDWVFASGYNSVSIAGPASVETPVRYDARRPLVVTAAAGEGRMTYTDLAFGPQWMSVHPGAFRLLANLISWRNP